MAKQRGERKRPGVEKAHGRAAEGRVQGSSPLARAVVALEEGDVVLARRLAAGWLEPGTSAGTSEDPRLLKELADQVFEPEARPAAPTAETIARELLRRARPEPKAFLFFGGGALALLSMVLLALSRT